MPRGRLLARPRWTKCDIHALIRNGTPPGQRFGLRAMRTDEGHPYWLIGA